MTSEEMKRMDLEALLAYAQKELHKGYFSGDREASKRGELATLIYYERGGTAEIM